MHLRSETLVDTIRRIRFVSMGRGHLCGDVHRNMVRVRSLRSVLGSCLTFVSPRELCQKSRRDEFSRIHRIVEEIPRRVAKRKDRAPSSDAESS